MHPFQGSEAFGLRPDVNPARARGAAVIAAIAVPVIAVALALSGDVSLHNHFDVTRPSASTAADREATQPLTVLANDPHPGSPLVVAGKGIPATRSAVGIQVSLVSVDSGKVVVTRTVEAIADSWGAGLYIPDNAAPGRYRVTATCSTGCAIGAPRYLGREITIRSTTGSTA